MVNTSSVVQYIVYFMGKWKTEPGSKELKELLLRKSFDGCCIFDITAAYDLEMLRCDLLC